MDLTNTVLFLITKYSMELVIDFRHTSSFMCALLVRVEKLSDFLGLFKLEFFMYGW